MLRWLVWLFALWGCPAGAWGSLPTEHALDSMCEQLYRSLIDKPVVPIAVIPDDPGEGAARLTAEHLVHCLENKGVYLVERRRISALVDQLKLDQAAGDPEAVSRLSSLSGAKGLIQIAMDEVDMQYTLTARLILVDGGAVQAVTRPVRVSRGDWRRWTTTLIRRKNRLIGLGLGAVLPGVGYLYHERYAIGWSVIAVEAGLATGALVFHLDGISHELAYRQDTQDSVGDRHAAIRSYQSRNHLLWAFAVVYGLQLVHLAFLETNITDGQPMERQLGWRF